jgi:hypothetical protein
MLKKLLLTMLLIKKRGNRVDNDNIEYIELIKLLCILSILTELSKEQTPIDDYRNLSLKNALN